MARLPGGMGRIGSMIVEAAPNVPSSAVRFATDVVQPIIHPIDTVKSLASLGSGVLQKLGLRSGTEDIAAADAVGKFLMDRYGSAEAIERTIRTDPVGIVADVSMILSGGGTAAARAPGMVGRFGEVAAAAGRTIDPLAATVRTATAVPRHVAGVMSGVAPENFRIAAAAGRKHGSPASEAFQANLRGAPGTFEETVAEARRGINQLRTERGKAYRAGMAQVGANTAILDFNRIDNALTDITGVKTFHGQVIEPVTQAIRAEIGQAVAKWRSLPPAIFHTPEGFDALKQQLGSIRDATEYGTPARVVADRAYHAVRLSIINQVPEYARVMQGYEQASNQLRAIERELSVRDPHRTNIDTALRKMQAALRNNVNTSFGRRAEMVDYLVHNGSPNLLAMIAGQSLNSWLPRGLNRILGAGSAEAIASALGYSAGGASAAAAMALTLPLMSPRLMGETAYYAGRTGPTSQAAGQGAYQVGRTALEPSPLAPNNF